MISTKTCCTIFVYVHHDKPFTSVMYECMFHIYSKQLKFKIIECFMVIPKNYQWQITLLFCWSHLEYMYKKQQKYPYADYAANANWLMHFKSIIQSPHCRHDKNILIVYTCTFNRFFESLNSLAFAFDLSMT